MQATRLFTVVIVSFLFSATAGSLEAQTITHVPLYTFNGDTGGASFGASVSGAGDVNGDGRADLIVGASSDGGGSGSGSARVLSGSDGSVLYNFDGGGGGSFFGTSVSGAGDVNGDGRSDLIVGALELGGSGSGSARVLSGSDGSVLYRFVGDSAGDRLGTSVSGAGDVNGDGTPDLIVGASLDDNNGNSSGSARVLSGSDGSVLHNFNGDGGADAFGSSVSDAGDVNGDGTPDLLVGAPHLFRGSGYARVLSGNDGSILYNFNGDSEGDDFGFSVSGAGDVNGDGFDDFIVGALLGGVNDGGSARVFSGNDGSVLYNFDGGASFGGQFGISVSGAGDVNGDGFDDFIVGALRGGANDGGFARVFSGSDGSVLYTFNGERAIDQFGVSVSGAGDVNGDGIDDFIVGSSTGGANFGGYARVFVSRFVPLGDCNFDGVVNFSDIPSFISILISGDYVVQADINEDGVVTFSDIPAFIEILIAP